MLPLTLRRVFVSVFAAAVLATGPALANDAAAKLVADVSSQVVQLLKSKPPAERRAGFTDILNRNFDLPLMGQAALGQYWNKATEEQRARFLKAAAAAESRAYTDRFSQYGGQTVSVGRVLTRPNGVFWVESQIVQPDGRPPIKLEWEVQDRGAGPRITDVKVEGVSMVMTRRSDFSSYISRNGGNVEPLIKELEARAN